MGIGQRIINSVFTKEDETITGGFSSSAPPFQEWDNTCLRQERHRSKVQIGLDYLRSTAIELPGIARDGSEFTLVRREEGPLKLYGCEDRLLDKLEDPMSNENACAFLRPGSVDLWHRCLAHRHEAIFTATAKMRDAGVVLKHELSPCNT